MASDLQMRIQVVGARGLPPGGRLGELTATLNPYFVLRWGETSCAKTSVGKNLNPVYDELVRLEAATMLPLEVELFHHATLGRDSSVAHGSYEVRDLVSDVETEVHIPLTPRGTLTLRITPSGFPRVADKTVVESTTTVQTIGPAGLSVPPSSWIPPSSDGVSKVPQGEPRTPTLNDYLSTRTNSQPAPSFNSNFNYNTQTSAFPMMQTQTNSMMQPIQSPYPSYYYPNGGPQQSSMIMAPGMMPPGQPYPSMQATNFNTMNPAMLPSQMPTMMSGMMPSQQMSGVMMTPPSGMHPGASQPPMYAQMQNGSMYPPVGVQQVASTQPPGMYPGMHSMTSQPSMGMQQIPMGMQPSMGMQPTYMGMQQPTTMGMHQSNMEIHQSNMGMQQSNMGMQPGMSYSNPNGPSFNFPNNQGVPFQ